MYVVFLITIFMPTTDKDTCTNIESGKNKIGYKFRIKKISENIVKEDSFRVVKHFNVIESYNSFTLDIKIRHPHFREGLAGHIYLLYRDDRTF